MDKINVLRNLRKYGNKLHLECFFESLEIKKHGRYSYHINLKTKCTDVETEIEYSLPFMNKMYEEVRCQFLIEKRLADHLN